MSITKDEVSDLKSLIDRAEQCAVRLQVAQAEKARADSNLESWLLRNTESGVAPWTVGLVHFDKKTGATVIWEEADFCSLPRAVKLIEQHFTEHQAEGFSESNLESRCK